MFKHLLSDSHFEVEESDSVLTTSIRRRVDIFISDLVHFRNAHISYLVQFPLFDSFADLFFEDFCLFLCG